MAFEDWRERLQACGDPELARVLVLALEALFQNNVHSLTVDASERHLAAEFAGYLKAQGLLAPDGKPWHVHVEYNRQGAKVKTIHGVQNVTPDVILHRAGTPQNFLAIELKKGSEAEPDADDMEKLTTYRLPHELGYQHALFLRLGVAKEAGTVACIVWA